MTAKNYRVAVAGWVNGKYEKEDGVVVMTPKAANYLVMSGQLVEDKPKSAPPASRKVKVKEAISGAPAAEADATKKMSDD